MRRTVALLAILMAMLMAMVALVVARSSPDDRPSRASAAGAAAIELASPSPRYTDISSSGSPGGVTPYQVVGTHVPVPCGGGYWSGCFQPGLTVAGVLASRSPTTSDAQTVLLSTVIFRWDSIFGWMTEVVDTQQVTVPAGVQTVRFADRTTMPNTGGAKYVAFGLAWNDQQGQELGRRVMAMNQRGDYVCQTRFTLACTVYDGFITITQP